MGDTNKQSFGFETSKKLKAKLFKLILFTLSLTVLIYVFLSTTSKGFMSMSFAVTNTGKFLDNLYISDCEGLEIYEENTEVDVISGTVSSTYLIKNAKQGTFRGKFKFPVRNNYKTNGMKVEKDTTNFNAYINGVKVNVTEELDETKKFDFYYTFENMFSGGVDTEVTITYETIWKIATDYSVVIGAYRESNTGFSGNIHHTKIVFDFGELSDYFVITPDDNSVYSVISSKFIWEGEDYSASEDIVLVAKPKLLKSNSVNTNYYPNKDGLKGLKILVDNTSLNKKKDGEPEFLTKAGDRLVAILKEAGAEAATTEKIVDYEKEINGKAKFDIVVSICLDWSSNPLDNLGNIYIEDSEKGHEEQFVESLEMKKYILNAGTSGIGNYFTNLKENNLAPSENVFTDKGSRSFNKLIYGDLPRVIVSLGYSSDVNKRYNKNMENYLEKIRLGLVLFEETSEYGDKEVKVTKDDFRIDRASKNFFTELWRSISKFFVYNGLTILICILLGAALGVGGFIFAINKAEKAIKEKFEKENEEKRNKWKAKVKGETRDIFVTREGDVDVNKTEPQILPEGKESYGLVNVDHLEK